jgi:hypothetical protein
MAVLGVSIVTEIGCFIKMRETKKTPWMWIDMVGNLNFTWTGPCIEILDYVRPPILPIPFALDSPPLSVHRMHAGRICRRTRHLDHVAFLGRTDGPDRQWRVVRPPKRMTTSRDFAPGWAGAVPPEPGPCLGWPVGVGEVGEDGG